MEQNQQMAGGKSIVRRSEEEILKLLNEQEQSGLSVKEYCEMFDIVEQTFYGWAKRYRSKGVEDAKDQAAVSGGFASIEVVPTLVHDKPQLFAEIGNIRLYKEVPAEYLKTLLS
jgi:transposase-like protein